MYGGLHLSLVSRFLVPKTWPTHSNICFDSLQVRLVPAGEATIRHYRDLGCQVILRGKDLKDVRTVGIGDQGVQRAKMRRVGGFQAKDLQIDLRNGEVETERDVKAVLLNVFFFWWLCVIHHLS